MRPDAVILVPTRCVGRWKLRAAESIRPVSGIRIPVAREYFGKRGVPIVPERKARRGGIARPYGDESQRG
ncbi:hypothetical protein [Candidatus Thiosymbion oneisti]|uniref:hypothetical protein n=1 Tax=Candidatus Thiosymbion oneisti TaxID=589554 RepID=UPI00105FAEDB|nr:hypothetical protein [Candidatus Thiosymbion oneisti]